MRRTQFPNHETRPRGCPERTDDRFTAFADRILLNDPDALSDQDEIDQAHICLALWGLANIIDPLAADVLDAIHAERRRRLSAATREGRRG